MSDAGVFIHPQAIVESTAIGIGTRIWALAHGAMIWEGVTIGDDVLLGPGVVFTNDARPRSPRFSGVRDKYTSTGWLAPTTVGRGASIGANCTISCGLSIGEFAMIGAGAVVTADIPAYVLAFGNPARAQGYVCVCGEKLPSFREGSAQCAACALRYRKSGKGVIAHE